MFKKVRLLAAACVSLAVVATGCTTTAPQNALFPTGAHLVDPCTTQAAILCSDNVLYDHIAAPPSPTVTPRHKLAIILNGTGSQPVAHNKLNNVLVADGFHVIALRYMSAFGSAGSCPVAFAGIDPDCHRRMRGEVTFGAGVPDPQGNAYDLVGSVDVNLANSTENRILQLVRYMVATFPAEGWEQYQRSTGGVCSSMNATYGACNVDWSKIVLVGHSLGAGQALYLSKFHLVNRLVMLSGPFDEYLTPALTLAPWITGGGFATPAASMYGFTHLLEPNYPNQSAAWTALGVLGPQVTVDGNVVPYAFSHQLTTNAMAGCTFEDAYHNSTAQDLCTPGPTYPPDFATAWKYLAEG
jgi:hypothetical protein